MRINGFEQIKAFYSWSFSNQDKGVKPQHISLYLFLINQNNRNNWVEWFKLPYDLAMAGSCISSKKTYYSCLQDLQDWKLIKYEKGVNNWRAPLIRVEVLKDTSTVPQSEPQPIQAAEPAHIQALIQAAEPLATHNIKLLTLNLKPITDNLQQVLSFLKIDSEIEFPDDFSQKKSDLTNALVSHYGFTEMKFSLQQKEIFQFVTNLGFTGRLDFFIEQFNDYQEFKKITKENVHSHITFLGTPAAQFANCAWDKENWKDKLKRFKDNGRDIKNTANTVADRSAEAERRRIKLQDRLGGQQGGGCP